MSEIIIKLKDHDVLCTFDKFGNLYFSLSDDPNCLYDLTITKTNRIICEKYVQNDDNGKLSSEDVYIGELVPFNNNNTLREKIINHNNNNDNESDSDSELIEDIEKKYFQENLEFCEYINKKDNYDEPYFSFNVISNVNNIENNLIFDRETNHALYDTLIYEGNPSSANLIMKTTLVNDYPLYRLCIFTSGDIKFRPIGSNEMSYKLNYDATHGLILI